MQSTCVEDSKRCNSIAKASIGLLVVSQPLRDTVQWQRNVQLKGSTWVQIIYAVSHGTFYCFFSVSHVIFDKNFTLSRHFSYMHLYYNYIYKALMSIFVFYKISTSILQFLYDFDVIVYSFYQVSRRNLQFLKWPCHTSFYTHVEP